MKHIFCLLLVGLPFISTAQFSNSIDLVGGVDYSYRRLTANSDDAGVQYVMGIRKNEVPRFNYRFGLNFNKRLYKGLVIKVGARYAKEGYKSEKKDNLQWPSEFVNGAYQLDPSLPHTVQYAYEYHFLEFPLMARYEFSSGKWAPFVEAGVAGSVFLYDQTITKTNLNDRSVQRNTLKNPNAFQVVGSVSCGVQYAASARWQLFAQPVFRYHFTQLIKDVPIREYLYGAGLELGVRRKW